MIPVSQLTAYSPVITETLCNIIAPGGRSRLSPFVESAQFQVLFGERPRPHKRFEDAHKILLKNSLRIEELAQIFMGFKGGGKSFEANIYDENFLYAYLAYYFTANVCKIQLVLLELVRQEKLVGAYTVLDIGVGTGTTAIAVLDFLTAWATTCDLYGVEFPIEITRLIGADSNENCRNIAARVVNAYADVLSEQVDKSKQPPHPVFKQVIDIARKSEWYDKDLNRSVIKNLPTYPVLLVASNVLNELTPVGKKNIEQTITTLSPQSMAIIVEPGDKNKTLFLNQWRKQLLQESSHLSLVAPCGVEFGNKQPGQCGNCWNARRASMHQTPLYKHFRELTNQISLDIRKKSFDDFENDLLSWSYCCLSHSAEAQPRLTYQTLLNQNGSKITTRYMGKYRKNETLGNNSAWVTHFKFCPGHFVDISKLEMKQTPGFEISPLFHGESVTINNTKIIPQSTEVILIPNYESEIVAQKRVLARQIFLSSYSERVRFAIDNIAYRLFGFPGMRDFQHTILEQVLTGRSILGIAATGGGKSECFILPAMLLSGITIVISPLKSLMQDQYDQRICERYGFDNLATFINGDVPFQERQAILKRMELGYYKLIYFTPEQLERGYILDSLRTANEKIGIRYLAIDEAHCISQWGHDFRPSYLNLIRRLKNWGIQPTVIALTATASPEVRRDLCDELSLDPRPLAEGGQVFVHSSNRPELTLIVRTLKTNAEKTSYIIGTLKGLLQRNTKNQEPGAAIVFMPYTGGHPDDIWRYLPDKKKPEPQKGRLSAGVTPFASYLERALNQQVVIYHSKMDNDIDVESEPVVSSNNIELGDLRGRTRQHQQKAFIQNRCEIMVATKGFGMGIDKSNIRLIIHRTPPTNLEAYAQEAGRAGRDGEIASAILYYSPDNSGEDEFAKSDHEIQKNFLSDKYIRRQDVVVMRAFFTNVRQKSGKYLYFTNDEAIQFFDVAKSYEWPKFAPYIGNASKEHREILEKRHIYEQKTNYIGRILSVLYRIRPSLFPYNPPQPFIEVFQETGIFIEKPHIKNSKAIIESNNYFGNVLRKKNVTPIQFEAWVKECETSFWGLLPFAEFLELSPSETAAMFQDIKNCSGNWGKDKKGKRKWVSNLLDFNTIVAPRRVDQEGNYSWRKWRDWLGAKRVTKFKAEERAKKRRLDKPEIDDWFGEYELTPVKGWEVLPGPAFLLDNEFEQYLNAFMKMHDERQRNDWAAYKRLLTDYVGVNEDGQLRSKQERNCLRAVMLGYLKSYEVIEGDNCFSCNRCINDNNYEWDIEKRKKIVVKLNEQTVELLDQLETYTQELPTDELSKQFWQVVEQEKRANRSLRAYIEGWTSRLLLDAPQHKAALWIRTIGMVQNFIPLQPQSFLRDIKILVEYCSKSELEQVWKIAETAHEFLGDMPEIQELQAIICHRLEKYSEEQKYWQLLLEHKQLNQELKHQAHVHLSDLYHSRGALPNPQNYQIHALEVVHTTSDPNQMLPLYQPLLELWNWPQLVTEFSWLKLARHDERLIPILVLQWLELNPTQEQHLLFTTYFTNDSPHKNWSKQTVLALLQDLVTKCQKIGLADMEVTYWQLLLDIPDNPNELIHQAHAALTKLYEPGRTLDKPELYMVHTLLAARTANQVNHALIFYKPHLTQWDWPQLLSEIEWLNGKLNHETLLPALILQWFEAKHQLPTQAVSICAYLEESRNFVNWSTNSFLNLLDVIPIDVIAQYFNLRQWYFEQTIQLNTPHRVPRLTELEIIMLFENVVISAELIKNLGITIFEKLSDEQVIELKSKHLATLVRLQRFLELLFVHYTPRNNTAIIRWFEWFAPVLTIVDIQIASQSLELLNQYISANLTPAKLIITATLSRLFIQPETRQQVHEIWLNLGKIWPEELIDHLLCCLSDETVDLNLAEAYWDILLKQIFSLNKEKFIFLRDELQKQSLTHRSNRIELAFDLFDILHKLVSVLNIRDLKGTDFKNIFTEFAPEKNISRADMCAAFIAHLRLRLNSFWATPYAHHVEVLCYAHRFEEAREVAKQYPKYPDLTVGHPKRQSVDEFINRLSALHQPRDIPANQFDYQQIIKVLI